MLRTFDLHTRVSCSSTTYVLYPKITPLFHFSNDGNCKQRRGRINRLLELANVPGFSAIYKTLKSDFIVKEITETGEVCSLTELVPRVDQELERKEKEMLENTLTTTTTAKEEDG